MGTFSQIIDKVVAETKRADMLSMIADWGNQSIREQFFDPQSESYILYPDAMVEDQLIIGNDIPFAWEIPDRTVFQAPGAARYDGVWASGEPVWADIVRPGRIMDQKSHFAYRSGNYVFFHGCGALGSTISFCWYEYCRELKYYPEASRPATWDVDTGWTYHADFDVDEVTRAEARRRVTNWILQGYGRTIQEGIKAKLYKRNSDEERARLAYSLYQSGRKNLASTGLHDGYAPH